MMLTGSTFSALCAPILHFLWSSCPWTPSQLSCQVPSDLCLHPFQLADIFASDNFYPGSPSLWFFCCCNPSPCHSLRVIFPSAQVKTLECIFCANWWKSKTAPQSGQNQDLDLKSCPKHSSTMNNNVIFSWYLGLHISDFHSSLGPHIQFSSESCMFFLA